MTNNGFGIYFFINKKSQPGICPDWLLGKSRHRATLPQGKPCSTIAADGLNFCVRDGNRCGPAAIDTSNLFQK